MTTTTPDSAAAGLAGRLLARGVPATLALSAAALLAGGPQASLAAAAGGALAAATLLLLIRTLDVFVARTRVRLPAMLAFLARYGVAGLALAATLSWAALPAAWLVAGYTLWPILLVHAAWPANGGGEAVGTSLPGVRG